MKIQLPILALMTSLFFCSCKEDPFKGLTSDEKKLATQLITQMKNDSVRIKKSNFTDELNSDSYYYFNDLFTIKTLFDPISEVQARGLQNNYTVKKRGIEGLFQGQMREQGGVAVDTKAIWIPTDSLKKFLGALIQYEVKSNQKTGIEIVLGSYGYDQARDRLMSGANRIHKDSLSGRTTVFFVATHDSLSNTKETFVSRHKAINPPGSKAVAGLSIINHGALCPDSCALTGY